MQVPACPPQWLVPQWPAPAWVRALCSTRDGGVSLPPYDSFNLGDHVQDDMDAVASNRQRLAEATGMRPVFLQQVHGVDVAQVDGASPTTGLVADASFTADAGTGCVVMVADCLPVLLAHRSKRLVGAAHAGWRGLAGGVLEQLLRSLQTQAGTSEPHDWLAWLGPCIGQDAFEVGEEVREAFLALDPQAGRHFGQGLQPGKWQADLAGLARSRLTALGIEVHGNDGTVDWCTFSQPARFYSYRRAARTGRFAAAIWMVD